MVQAATGLSEDAGALLGRARRVTLKIGSSLLIDPEGSGVRRDWLASVGDDIALLRSQGKQVLVVSSGAVALGRRHLGLRASPRLDHKQAAAAAGQALLMQAWERAMAPHLVPTAQLLLTIDDSEQRRRWLNARATLEVLFAQNALPVVNENDSVATEELRYGDNDRLSARCAQMIQSDLLILLSDVDGLYTADPRRDPEARHIPFVAEIESVESFAAGTAAAGVGTGGMRTKLAAASIAQAFGCATLIARGHDANPISRLAGGALSTIVAARGSPASAYKQWIAASLAPAGSLVIDAGAVAALSAGKSLLPAGARSVDGRFHRGACLSVRDADGREIARGITSYASDEIRAILGCGSDRVEEKLGFRGPDELIHRNDLVLL